jgi:hypothetical protein
MTSPLTGTLQIKRGALSALPSALLDGQLYLVEPPDPLRLYVGTTAGNALININISGAISADYITGCALSFSSATAFNVGSGTAYVPAASAGVTSAGFTVTPSTGGGIAGGGAITLAASTLYYVYLASATTVEVSSTPPTLYEGTAGESAVNHRYIGAFLTDASGYIVPWLRMANHVYYTASTVAAPYLVGSGLTAYASAASVSCAAVVPATSRLALADVSLALGYGFPAQATMHIGFAGSDGYTPTNTTGITQISVYSVSSEATLFSTVHIPLSTAQAFEYIMDAMYPTAFVVVRGYIEDR